MSDEKNNNSLKGSLLFLAGVGILTIGLVLILGWWPYTVLFFKGTVGIVLALAGMLMLFLAKR